MKVFQKSEGQDLINVLMLNAANRVKLLLHNQYVFNDSEMDARVNLYHTGITCETVQSPWALAAGKLKAWMKKAGL